MGLFRAMGDLGYVVGPVALAALAGTTGAVSSAPFFLAAAVIFMMTLPLVRTSDPAAMMVTRQA